MNRTSDTLDKLEQPLREVLAHFYDSSYEPSHDLWELLGIHRPQSLDTLWSLILRATESLEPSPEVPATSHSWRLYNILVCRYTKAMTQEQTAEHLGLSPRHLRREQQLAVRVLAKRLLEETLEKPQPVTNTAKTEPSSWSSQVKQELASLQKNAPGVISNVREVILKVVERSQMLTAKSALTINLEAVEQNLTVTLHPSVLQQILTEMVEAFIHQTTNALKIRAERQNQTVIMTVSGSNSNGAKLSPSEFVREILAAEGGSIKSYTQHQETFVELALPSAYQRTVLVVDDNQDLVHFYKRYTANTKYQIQHVSEGHRVLETALTLSPDMILLDVMLPDTDGWELLTQLHAHPATRSIPVIVCSVIKSEEFASALGAAKFLAKPVGRQQFLAALESVSSPRS